MAEPGKSREFNEKAENCSVRAGSFRFRPEPRFFIMLLLSGGTYLISASIGSGWVLFLSAGLLASCVLALLIPFLALRSVSLDFYAPERVSAGQELPVVLHFHAPPQLKIFLRWLILKVEASSLDLYAESREQPLLLDAPESGIPVNLICAGLKRGIRKLPAVSIESSFPLGIVWCKAIFRPQRKLAVLPEVEKIEGKFLRELHSSVYVAGESRASNSGLQSCCARGVRPYVRGDSRRFIHWSLSARHAALMVRELEHEGTAAYDLVFDLEAPWSNDSQFELAVIAAASILQLGHFQGVHPELFIVHKALGVGDEVPDRCADIDEQMLLLASLKCRIPSPKADPVVSSAPEALAGRSRASVLLTPAAPEEKDDLPQPGSGSSVFVLKIAPGAASASMSGSSLLIARREDFDCL